MPADDSVRQMRRWFRLRNRWLGRAVRVEVCAVLRDDLETYGRAARLLARMDRRFPLERIRAQAAEMACRHAGALRFGGADERTH